MSSRRAGIQCLALTMMLWFGGCGGGDNPSPLPPPSNPNPNNPTPPTTSATNPCTAVGQQDVAGIDGAGIEGASIGDAQVAASTDTDPYKRYGLSGDDRDVRDSLWEHYLRGASDAAVASARAAARTAASQDIGEIAVLEDDTTLMLRQNAFDLRNLTLHFERNGNGGYDVTRQSTSFYQSLGTQLALTDDSALQQTIQFGFPYFGASRTSVFINSDGNLTFGESDTASTARGFARLLGGPARIAPFFADLDPSISGGRIFVRSSADAFVVTYCSVRGFESQRSVTVQAALLPSGVIDITFGDQIDLTEGIVAISPGQTSDFTAVDLSATSRNAGGTLAVGERFSEESELDLVAATKRFYQSHADNFDQVLFWSDTTVVGGGTFAFESTVANEIRGIGLNTFDQSRDYGSGGRLRSVVVMDRLGKYPDDPAATVLGENSTLSVMGQEVGHRWLSFLRFRTETGQTSDLLLGRDLAHWSFFFDSDASVMEGNDIEDLGGGSFRTAGSVQRYSRLDQYAMGLVGPNDVPRFFYVDTPINVQPARERDSAPRTGVTFNGTRRDVLIQDVVDAVGVRQPTSAESPRTFRQAFVYIVSRGATASSADVAKLDRIRREWAAFFNRATEGRMTSETSLR